MTPGAGVSWGLLGPEDRWLLQVVSRPRIPRGLPCTLCPRDFLAEEPGFLHEGSGLPKVSQQESFQGPAGGWPSITSTIFRRLGGHQPAQAQGGAK